MQIRATKVFAKELTKQLKGNYCIESVELVKIPRDRAYITVGGGYSDIDIDWDDNTVKVLQVNYKPECYAMSVNGILMDVLKLHKTNLRQRVMRLVG